MGEQPLSGVEALYEEVRRAMPVTVGDATVEIAQVTPRIRVLALRTPTLPPAAHTNAYVVGPPQGPVVVVDPGSPYADQQFALETCLAGLDVALVLLTHHHGDHTGGAVALAARSGAAIGAHATTARLLDGIVPVTRMIADGEVITVGDTTITAVYTPGHAEGHLCFEVAGEATIAGDMVAGLGTILIDPDEGDMTRYLASLELLLARPPRTLLPAHGPPIVDGHGKLREYLAHRRMREERVLAAVTGHPSSTFGELVPVAYADTPRALWMLAERSLMAHVKKLVADGRVRELPGGRFASVANPL